MNWQVERQGSGSPLLLIHGWGMHSGLWGNLVPQLAEHFQVITVDLPGHGNSARQDFSLDSLVAQLSAQFEEPLSICGWSLGGQLALHWALRFPPQINRLVLVACTPCFVRRPGWDCAMPAETFAEFSASLQQNPALTLRRFLALQTMERALLSQMRSLLASRKQADSQALRAGLELLRDLDLRDALPGITQPALIMAGFRDTLTPMAAAQYLATQMPDARLAAIEGAAHVPFLSHQEVFLKHLLSFLHG